MTFSCFIAKMSYNDMAMHCGGLKTAYFAAKNKDNKKR